MNRKTLMRLGWFILVSSAILLTGCDGDDELVATRGISDFNQIIYHMYRPPDHCETIQILSPNLKKGALFRTSEGIFHLKTKPQVDPGDLIVLLAMKQYEQIQNRVIWKRFDPETFRWHQEPLPISRIEQFAILNNIIASIDDYHWSDLVRKVDVIDETKRATGAVELDPQYKFTSKYADKYRNITTKTIPLVKISAHRVEVWDYECRPKATSTAAPSASPTPRATPSTPMVQVAVTRTAAAPTPTPTAAQPTPPPGEVVFFTRPAATGPCTHVRFRFKQDAQGRPDLDRPITLSYLGLTYHIVIDREMVDMLDRSFTQLSPREFRALVAEVLYVQTGSASDSGMPVVLRADSPIVHLFYLLWSWRALSAEGRPWWVARGPVHWRDPDCSPRPTAVPRTPTPTPAYQVAVTPGPSPSANPTANPTPGSGPGTPTPRPQPTPTPQPPTPTPTPAVVCQDAVDVTNETLSYINALRQEHGLPPVGAASAALRRATKETACLMRRHNALSHSPGGITPRERLQRHGVTYQVYVENIVVASSPQEAVRKWRDSAAHLANMLNASITGCAAAFSGGYYALGCIGP